MRATASLPPARRVMVLRLRQALGQRFLARGELLLTDAARLQLAVEPHELRAQSLLVVEGVLRPCGHLLGDPEQAAQGKGQDAHSRSPAAGALPSCSSTK